ncbi:unnamed protein product [Zymoseptoria tritici ST99CH_3D1]|nr:unnamed protein product [Zymoseptoria tritici ST99CH_3D1]
MPPAGTSAELQEHRNKLANSYQSLLSEFSSPEFHTVGNYALGRLIGKGSFGKVYLASHKLTNGSKVVLKSAKKDDANLAREIHHHRQFSHPHIARLHEVIVTETLVWLVLEYCPGDELYNHIHKNGRMEVGKAQKVFTQLVGAVNYVHAKGCVHRDLKLENILLDKNENVKLVDFGFTREYKGSTSYLQTWCGTVCYSAPEMLKGEKYAGEKVDVWSLGIILYALLCGELPYDEDDESDTKNKILKEEPKYPDHMPEQAKDLIKKLLSKRPLLRPSLGDILRDPFLYDHAPQQQEILKLQQPPPFTTQLEKDVLQRMKSAGVNIDTVIENVLSQRCDSLAGWWSLLLEKEQRKDRRRERRRKEREAESKSIRRLSAASGRLLANLGEIHEGEENFLEMSPRSRGRRLERANANVAQVPDLPKVVETKSATPDGERAMTSRTTSRPSSTSRSRPPPPPKDTLTVIRPPPRGSSRGSQSKLSNVVTNPDLLSPSYVPPPQRKRPKFYPPPLEKHLAWVKHFFKEGTLKRNKSPAQPEKNTSNIKALTKHANNSRRLILETGDLRNMRRLSTHQTPATPKSRRSSVGRPTEMTVSRVPVGARPRINTASSAGSTAPSIRNSKRTSLSPHTLTPHSSYRRSGLIGRKSTSSSVSSIRSAYHGQPTHSKTSSTSSASASLASPSGLSSASGSRMARSPHSSVKMLPSNSSSTSPFPNGLRFSRRPPPADIRTSSANPISATATSPPGFPFSQSHSGSGLPPVSPGLPIFARRKRHVFKGPSGGLAVGTGGGGSPAGFGRGVRREREVSGKGRGSTEISGMPGVVEENEDEEEEEEEEDEDGFEDVVPGLDEDAGAESPPVAISPGAIQFGPELMDEVGLDSPTTVGGAEGGGEGGVGVVGGGGVPLTAEALKMMEEENAKVVGKGKDLVGK